MPNAAHLDVLSTFSRAPTRMVTVSAAKGTLSGLVGFWSAGPSSAGGWAAGGWAGAASIVTYNQGRHVVQRMLNLCFLQSSQMASQ
jgi:hypothetical protein